MRNLRFPALPLRFAPYGAILNQPMNTQIISITIAGLALFVSFLTAWFTLFHKGAIKMTQPTVMFFGPDGRTGPPKIFLRTLLFSTARKGHVLENMYVKLRRNESVQNFNIWVCRDKADLVRGSGLFVGNEGIACDHHFLLPKDGTDYEFLQGEYSVKVFASLMRVKNPVLLFTQKLFLSEEFAAEINNEKSGVYFDWGPDSKSYHSFLDKNPDKSLSVMLRKDLGD